MLELYPGRFIRLLPTSGHKPRSLDYRVFRLGGKVIWTCVGNGTATPQVSRNRLLLAVPSEVQGRDWWCKYCIMLCLMFKEPSKRVVSNLRVERVDSSPRNLAFTDCLQRRLLAHKRSVECESRKLRVQYSG